MIPPWASFSRAVKQPLSLLGTFPESHWREERINDILPTMTTLTTVGQLSELHDWLLLFLSKRKLHCGCQISGCQSISAWLRGGKNKVTREANRKQKKEATFVEKPTSMPRHVFLFPSLNVHASNLYWKHSFGGCRGGPSPRGPELNSQHPQGSSHRSATPGSQCLHTNIHVGRTPKHTR